jgi:AcrR family transcriptional regulator
MAHDSRTRIRNAALAEFSAHGFAGARVSRIASLSRTNKQLIYYYFGSKGGLYQQVLDQVYDEVMQAEKNVPRDLEHDLLYWMDFHHEHPYLLRLLEWDGLTYPGKGKGRQRPRQMWKTSLERIENNQGSTGWPEGFRGAQTLIACLALATWPLAFPEVCRQITGLDPADPRFVRDRRKFIGEFVKSLSARRSTP